jgi:hypothetical protein
MTTTTLVSPLLASPSAHCWQDLTVRLVPELDRLVDRLRTFLDQEVTPAHAFQVECDLSKWLRDLGRVILAWLFHQLEPTDQAPEQLEYDHEIYRRRDKSSKRSLSSLFGPIRLWRHRYDPATPGEASLFPLEMRLGIEGGATAALAERAALGLADQPQQSVLANLKRDQGVSWSAQTLRDVTAKVSAGMAEHREKAPTAKVQELLQQAEHSAGPQQPVLSVGRDGVMVPMRDSEYHEAATGTVSVLDRRGRRLGTVYLGRMPEEGQRTLSRQLTALIVSTLATWTGALPRLQYVTDGGHAPANYFKNVLRKMTDPRRPGRRLQWLWVIDFYHACTYISKLAEALCGVATAAWGRKMCRWMRDKSNGVYRVLHSAAALRRRTRKRAEQKLYRQGYNYLRKHKKFMDYHAYRRRGLAIGSGITEAACKTVFTQRLKQSGMRWETNGGQVVVDLRILRLSGVWQEVHRAYLAAKPLPETHGRSSHKTIKIAA